MRVALLCASLLAAAGAAPLRAGAPFSLGLAACWVTQLHDETYARFKKIWMIPFAGLWVAAALLLVYCWSG